MDTFKFLLAMGLGCSIFIGSILLASRWWELNIIDVVPITATVDNKIVYQGKSACITVSSGGRTTTLTVLGGFMCFFPQKEYVSENVHVEGVK